MFWGTIIGVALFVLTVHSLVTLWRNRHDRVAPSLPDALTGVGTGSKHYGEDAASQERHQPVPSITAGSPNDRPLASLTYEEHALTLFRLEMPTEEYAARFAHQFMMFNFDKYQYRTPGMTEWVDRLSAFFFAADLPLRLRAVREKYLTPAEVAEVEAYEHNP